MEHRLDSCQNAKCGAHLSCKWEREAGVHDISPCAMALNVQNKSKSQACYGRWCQKKGAKAEITLHLAALLYILIASMAVYDIVIKIGRGCVIEEEDSCVHVGVRWFYDDVLIGAETQVSKYLCPLPRISENNSKLPASQRKSRYPCSPQR